MTKPASRRQFVQATAAAIAAPTIVPSSVFAKPAPSDRVVVGSIGTGDLGRRHHLNVLMGNKRVEVAAVCDVDRNHRDQAAKDVLARKGTRVGVYEDFRDLCDRTDLDAVLIAVPDHWHALTANYAMESGKDVYCEKPLTLTIEESIKMLAVARRYGTVLQTGSQQRSDKRFRLACLLARNGKLGRLLRVDTNIGHVDNTNWMAVATPPPWLNWNFWLGPAPYADYVPNRVHYQFRWMSDYSGGKMTDWGAHHNDIAQWGIGADGSGPVKVSGTGKFFEEGPFDVASTFDVVYSYGSQHGNVELHCHSGGENGAKFTGSDGWCFVSRERIAAEIAGNKLDQAALYKEFPDDSFKTKLYVSHSHHDNWLDCIKSREKPICDVEIGHRSVTVCHLGNIALKLGRELQWDPAAEKFVNDEQANRMIGRPMRAPWTL